MDISQTDLAYLAGLIDGEGWIGLGRRKRSWLLKRHPERTHYLRPVIAIGMATRECLDKVAAILKLQVQQIRLEGEIYRLRIYPTTLRWLLPQLRPHLALKGRQAEILMEFLSVPYRGKELSVEEFLRRELLAEEIRRCNERPSQTRRRLASQEGVYSAQRRIQ